MAKVTICSPVDNQAGWTPESQKAYYDIQMVPNFGLNPLWGCRRTFSFFEKCCSNVALCLQGRSIPPDLWELKLN